jgi:hypothetical protein
LRLGYGFTNKVRVFNMETDIQSNFAAVIPVKIFGMDADGEPFMQLATAHNLTPERAILDRIEHRLTPGEVVGLQHQEHRTRVRVLWSCEVDGVLTSQVGVQLIDLRECPWITALVSSHGQESKGPGERRRFPRHRVSIGMELSETLSGQRMRASSTDVSLGGCYIETILPLAVGTRLEVEMWVDPSRVAASAIVRTCDPGVGMGIEFIGVTPEKEQQLQDLLLSCSHRMAAVL